MTIGKKIAKLRKEHQLSQQALANQLNVTRQTISKWENDLALPSVSDLNLLCAYFNHSIEDLLSQETHHQNDLENIYRQIEIVFEKNEKEMKKRTIFNTVLIIVCCLSMIFTIFTGNQLNQLNEKQTLIQNWEEKENNKIIIGKFDKEMFGHLFVNIEVGYGSNESFISVSKYNLQKQTVKVNYQFILKEYYDATTMSIIFDQEEYSLEKINENTFVFNEEIPLKNYDSVIFKIQHPSQYVIEGDLGKNGNCHYLTALLYNSTSFYLSAHWASGQTILNQLHYEKDVRDRFLPDVNFWFNTGDINVDIYSENGELIESIIYSLGQEEEKILDVALPTNQILKIVATITLNNQEVEMIGTLSPTKKTDERIYVKWNQEVSTVW